MDNLVKNAYNAFHIDNSLTYGSYISISGAAFPSEEFALDIWFNVTEGSAVLLSQKDGFSLGIENNKIIFRHPAMKTITVKNSIMKIPDKTWNNLYMGYNKQELSFYINGIKFDSVKCTTHIRNSENFIIGEEFTGYIRFLRLYKKVISEQDFKNYCFASEYTAAGMPDIAAFIDFTQKHTPDLSGKNVKAQIHEGCALVDLVDIYSPSEDTYASFPDSSNINPGGFTSGAFSVYVKLYTRPSPKKRQVIVANGNWDEHGSIVIFSEKSGNTVGFGMRMGTEECVFAAKIGDYTWVDVIACLNGKTVTAYINGVKYSKVLTNEFQRTQNGDFKIGGCRNISDMTCSHYLHTVAVFDKVLQDKDASDFMANHPFILEDNLVALIDFEGGNANELVNGIQVNAASSDLFPAQRTVDILPDSPYQFRVNYTQSAASDMQKWEAELLVEEYKSFARETYGLSCTAGAAAITALAACLSHKATLLANASDLYMDAELTSKSISKSISKINSSFSKTMYKGLNLLKGAATVAASTTAAAGTSAVTGTGMQFAALFSVGCTVVIGAALSISSAIKDKHKDKPDKDDSDVTTSISSMTFQHSPDNYKTSAVRCRNLDGVIIGAEWNKSSQCINPAVYIADEVKKIKIKIKFKIIDKSSKPKGTYDISLSASVVNGIKNLFDHFKYEKQGLLADKEYEAELESSIDASVAKTFCYTRIELWWSCYVNGEGKPMPNTKSDIYIIPTKPCPPILMDKGCNDALISVEYLQLFTRIFEKNTYETTSEAAAKETCSSTKRNPLNAATFNELIAKTGWLYSSPFFKYAANAVQFIKPEPLKVYNKIVGQLIIFHEKEFLGKVRDIMSGKSSYPIEIECEVYAAILSYYFNMQRISCRLTYVFNPEPADPEHPESGRYEELQMSNVYPAGALEIPQDPKFTYHMIVEVSPQRGLTGIDGVRVFDASMGVMVGSKLQPLAGIPFYGQNTTRVNKAGEAGTYRGLAVKDNTGAVIVSEVFAFVKV